MKHVLLIIGGLLLLSAGRGVQVVEEEEGASLERRQQELAIEVLSLYLEVDSMGTRQRPPSGFSQAAECFPGTGDADPAAADGAGGADSHGAALHAAKRELAGYDCRNY